jgi:hypothetical protein
LRGMYLLRWREWGAETPGGEEEGSEEDGVR